MVHKNVVRHLTATSAHAAILYLVHLSIGRQHTLMLPIISFNFSIKSSLLQDDIMSQGTIYESHIKMIMDWCNNKRLVSFSF